MLIDRRLFSHFDWELFALILLIPCAGLTVLYSAGYDQETKEVFSSWLGLSVHSPAFMKQLYYFSIGLFVLFIGAIFPPSLLHRYAYVFYVGAISLLVLVLAAGVVSNGSRRWFALGSFNFQPAELMKFALVLAMARYLSKTQPPKGGFGMLQIIVPFLIFLVPMALIMKQPDLGTALSIGAIGFAMVLFMGIRIRTLVAMVLVVALAIPLGWRKLHDYQQRRVLVLFNPDVDPLGSGYHITQSKIAVGSGSFFGKGFLKGTQTQLEFLPEHTTDFVFSVLAEEWGFLGCTVVLVLYLLLVYRLLRVVLRSRDLFASLVAFGVASLFFFHVLINVGMVVGLLPVVGIPLPLFSYGGTSVLSFMFALGVVLGISMRRFWYVARS